MNTLRRLRELPPALLQPVTTTGLLRNALFEWLLIGLCWLAMYYTPLACWPVQGLWIMLVAGRLHALGVILHDACHQRTVPHDKESFLSTSWLEWLAGYPVTTTLPAMRYHHLRHHRDSCMAQDPYFKAGASERWAPAVLARLRGLLLPPAWILRSYLGCLAVHWPALRGVYTRVFLGDRTAGAAPVSGAVRCDQELMTCLRAERGQALFFLIVASAWMLYPSQVTVGYLLPLLVAGLLNAHRVVAEHRHIAVHDRSPATVLASTYDHPNNCLNRWLMFPRNIGYHTVHHLHPTVAWQSLPALHAWYLKQVPEFARGPRADNPLGPTFEPPDTQS
jgi:fatty acid desaturase